MSKVPWHVLRSDHPRAHLVAALIEAAELVGSPDLKTAKTVLERLVKTLAPTGDYATSIVRETGQPEVHLAFKAAAAMRNMSMKDLLEASFRLWLDTHGDDYTRNLLPPKVDKSDKRS